ncbi:NTP transferase domain-containing protein [Croceicoccus hydrothermalis]|uniref:phosphocholine cytidylyltransferase family protein n=1 Tax=Croceicoccus hydrothermalis TaxID=2867964 RepID=UPI001EFB9D85|nr:NTP transferase domain-containing protein [Croceicoccus hydrothermalis]
MIRTGILLAAGFGSRLRAAAPCKPLCPVGGRALIDHALDGMGLAGMERVIVVVGHEADAIRRHISGRRRGPLVEVVPTPDPTLPNGVSVLAAERALAGQDGVLAMCDHLVVPELYARIARRGAGGGACLAVDRRLDHPWIDKDDVTCVRTREGMIADIGKGLTDPDCYDMGVFAIAEGLFDALRTQSAPSLSDGMRQLGRVGLASTLDCSDLDWIDVDDPIALNKAETWWKSARHEFGETGGANETDVPAKKCDRFRKKSEGRCQKDGTHGELRSAG